MALNQYIPNIIVLFVITLLLLWRVALNLGRPKGERLAPILRETGGVALIVSLYLSTGFPIEYRYSGGGRCGCRFFCGGRRLFRIFEIKL